MSKLLAIFRQKFDDTIHYNKVPTTEQNDEVEVSRNGDTEFMDDDEKSSHKISSSNAFWNVCNSIQGVAILAMPYVIKGGGWWSVVAMVIVAAISNYTGQILIKCHYEEIHEDQSSIVYVRTRYKNISNNNFFFFQKSKLKYFLHTVYCILYRNV